MILKSGLIYFWLNLCGSHLYVRYLSACSFKMPTYPERGNSAGGSVGMIGYSSPAKEPTIRWSQRVLRVRDGKKRWPFSTRWWQMKWHQTSRAPWLQKRGLGPVLFSHLGPWWHSHKASWDFTGKPTGPVPHGWMVKTMGHRWQMFHDFPGKTIPFKTQVSLVFFIITPS